MKLFETIKIGKTQLKNRLVMPPISTNFSKDGFVNERIINYYAERAKGGVGLIVVEPGTVEYPRGNFVKTNLALDHDKYIPLLKKLTSAVHDYSGKVSIQIGHGGRRAGRLSKKSGCLEITRGKMPVGPSAIAHPVSGHVVPNELSINDIELILEKFKKAGIRAIESGFDFISLHCAHMYLIGQFLSPWANKRNDKYGKGLDGRMRFVTEIIRSMKSAIGNDFPIICRLNGQEPSGGNSLEEIKEIAIRLQEEKVSALHVSVGFGSSINDPKFIPSVTSMKAPANCAVHLAANIKKVVSIPVIAVNKIKDIENAEQILQQGRADLIAMGRPLIADPYLPKKAIEGKNDNIRPCIYCCQGCVQNVLEKNEPLACSVNPLAGHEQDKIVNRASHKFKVLVIGGGPAGIQAALAANKKGHYVYLVDKEKQLGGQLLLALKPPGKIEINRYLKYLKRQILHSEVKIQLGRALTQETLDKIDPDAVILATGSIPIIPQIPGINKLAMTTAHEVFGGKVIQGKTVLIIGGGTIGCEVADYLSEQGKDIIIIEISNEVATNMPQIATIPLINDLRNKKVKIITNTNVISVTKDGVWIKTGDKKDFVIANEIVVAVGSIPNREIEGMVKLKDLKVFRIGDNDVPGTILKAVSDGFNIGKSI